LVKLHITDHFCVTEVVNMTDKQCICAAQHIFQTEFSVKIPFFTNKCTFY